MKRFDEVKGFFEGFAAVKMHGKWSYINREGKLIAPLQYDEAEQFTEGFARVKKYGRWGFINTDGKEFSADNALECFFGAEKDIKDE